jgi:hypothetical protein
MEEQLEDWENFQIENDSVRNLILSYLTLKCEYVDSLEKNETLNLKAHKLECEKFHNQEEMRRKPFKDGKLIYESEICPSITEKENSSMCINGLSCTKSHNMYEYLFHPAVYRSRKCENQECREASMKFCPYAHNQQELRNGNIYLKNNKQKNTQGKNSKILLNSHLPQQFNLSTFKINKCSLTNKHNEKQCLGFHSIKDRRRNPHFCNYSSEMCSTVELEKNCQIGDYCQKSHNKVEAFYHPLKFKTKFCSHFSLENPYSISKCSYGDYCSFAHSEKEIKIELIHHLSRNEEFFTNYFKTVLCPFTHAHEKAICVYAHNWQDFRRNPKVYIYKNHSCPRWDNKKTILNYKDGCSEEYNCFLCHGWKEEDFHPLNYKTKKCKNFNKNCGKKEFCPFFHDNEEKRRISNNLKEDFEHKLKIRKSSINSQNSINHGKLKNFQSSYNMNNISSHSAHNLNNQQNQMRMNKSQVFLNNNTNNPMMINLMKNLNISSENFIPRGSEGNYYTPTNSGNKSFTYNRKNTFNNFPHLILNKSLSNFSNVSPNNSYTGNLSDNELESQNQQAFAGSKFFIKNKPSFKSRHSNYSNHSDNSYNNSNYSPHSHSSSFNESFRNESGSFNGPNIYLNQDDSIDLNHFNQLNDLNKKNFSTNDRSSTEINLENLEKNNFILKQLLKDSDIIINKNTQENTKPKNSKEEFLNYLKYNSFNNLYHKLMIGEVDIKNLVGLPDELILSYVEPENIKKFEELSSMIMKLDVNMDGEDLLKIINNDFDINTFSNFNNFNEEY